MPASLQPKLLRALQDGEVRRVGDVRTSSVDVRILCATNRDLDACVAGGRFREDLYYRLKVFTLTLPPLRDRVEDILPLAAQFLAKEGHATGRFTPAAARALGSCRWPGNIRELQNAVIHGAVLAGHEDVDVDDLPRGSDAAGRLRAPAPGFGTLAEIERAHVQRAIEFCGGRQGDAAKILGVGRTTLSGGSSGSTGSPCDSDPPAVDSGFGMPHA